MKSSSELIAFIEEKRKEKGINISKFSRRCGVVRSHYYSMIKGGGCGFDTAVRILGVLGYGLTISSSSDDGITISKVKKKKKNKKKKIIIKI